MKWVILLLVINANILIGSVVYRVWLVAPDQEVSRLVYQTTWALHRDHVNLEHQLALISKQLGQCRGLAI